MVAPVGCLQPNCSPHRQRRLRSVVLTTIATLTAWTLAPRAALAYVGLQMGDRGTAVLNLQKLLEGVGQNTSTNGRYDFKTQQALRTFQSEIVGFQPTGILDSSTTAALLDLNRDPRPGRPLPPQPFLVRGDRGPSVWALQARLREAGFFPASLPLTSLFDNTTHNALLDYQKASNLPTTGVVDLETQAQLDRVSREPRLPVPAQPQLTLRPAPPPRPVMPRPAPPPEPLVIPVLPLPVSRLDDRYVDDRYAPASGGQWSGQQAFGGGEVVLGPGQVNPRVVRLQGQLRHLGYLKSRTNTGYFGPLTQAAVMAYQAAEGLPVTGSVDREMLCHLRCVKPTGRRGSPYVRGYRARPWPCAGGRCAAPVSPCSEGLQAAIPPPGDRPRSPSPLWRAAAGPQQPFQA